MILTGSSALIEGAWDVRDTLVAIGAASISVVSPNPARVGLIFSVAAGPTITLRTVAPVISGRGIVVQSSTPPIYLPYRDWGGLVTREWFGIASGAGGFLNVLELIWTPSRLRSGEGRCE